MKEITEITSQKKGDRLNIYLDGSFAFGVDYSTAVKFGLKTGKVLSESDVAAINAEEGNIAAFNRGLKYAVKKVVSKSQMIDYLTRNGYSEEALQLAIDKLTEYGYINDFAYAKAFIATYGGARSKRRLSFELKNAGISDKIIGELLDEADFSDACDACIDKYLRTHKSFERQKLIKYLLTNGFEWDTINENLSRRDI